jgi:hypothetical protein
MTITTLILLTNAGAKLLASIAQLVVALRRNAGVARWRRRKLRALDQRRRS